MPSVLSKLFRRPQGSGWLVLSGGSMQEGLIQRAVALVDQAGSLVAVVPAPDDLPAAENALQTWLDVCGWDGRAVDCQSSDTLEESLSEAALVLLPDLADAQTYSRALGQTDACEFLLAALDAGVVIVAEGPAAEALGEQIESPSAPAAESTGLRWIPGAVVQTHFPEADPPPITFQRKELFRIGLPGGVSIALGPGDEREIWGEGKPTITFRQWWDA